MEINVSTIVIFFTKVTPMEQIISRVGITTIAKRVTLNNDLKVQFRMNVSVRNTELSPIRFPALATPCTQKKK